MPHCIPFGFSPTTSGWKFAGDAAKMSYSGHWCFGTKSSGNFSKKFLRIEERRTRVIGNASYLRVSSSIFWRFFSPMSSAKSIVGKYRSTLCFLRYSRKSVRFRFAKFKTASSYFSGRTEKYTVTVFRSLDTSALVTVMRDCLLDSRAKKSPAKCAIVSESWMSLCEPMLDFVNEYNEFRKYYIPPQF